MRLIVLLLWFLLVPGAAAAAPIFGAIGAAWTAVTTFAASSWLAGVFVRTAAALALSALAIAIRGRPGRDQASIATPYTMTGEVNAETFVLGQYATAGQLVYPPLTHGGTTGTEYKTFVIALSCLPGCQLLRVSIGGEWAPFTGATHPDYGKELGGKYTGYAWVKFYDGTQTTADPMLLAKYGSHPDFPWAADMVGEGVCWAIVTLRANTSLFAGQPRMRFELSGIPMYDPRADSTAGGVGTQRWNDRATWSPTRNPAVMIYNILRGIDIGLGDIWGGQAQEADLPYAIWAAAMDACDALVDDGAGNMVPAYEAGIEVRLDRRPADVIAELQKSCTAALSDVGGRWLIRVGAPALPSGVLLDDDIVVTEGRELRPAASLSDTHNAVAASWVDPASVYQPRDATLWEDQAARQEDGNRKLVADVQLPAVTRAHQVTRLQKAWLADDRRWRTHVLALPPRMVALEPFDVLAWTSARNGYNARPFEVASVLDDPLRMVQRVTLREIDYADWQ